MLNSFLVNVPVLPMWPSSPFRTKLDYQSYIALTSLKKALMMIVFTERQLRKLPKIHTSHSNSRSFPVVETAKVLRHELVSIFVDMKKRLAL